MGAKTTESLIDPAFVRGREVGPVELLHVAEDAHAMG